MQCILHNFQLDYHLREGYITSIGQAKVANAKNYEVVIVEVCCRACLPCQKTAELKIMELITTIEIINLFDNWQ